MKDIIAGYVQNTQIIEVQKGLLHSILFTETGWEQFLSIRSVVPNALFGKYRILYETIVQDAKSYTDLSIEKNSTEIAKQGLNMDYIDILSCTFTRSDIFDDIKYLVKNYYTQIDGLDDLERLTTIHGIYKTIDEKRVFDASKAYMIRELYDGAIEDLTEKSKRKREGKTLGYSTGFQLIDRFTEGIQKGTVTRLNAYSNVGKSKFSYQIVNKLLEQGAHVLYFSLEVQKNMVIYQMMANKYKIDIAQVYRMEFGDIDFGELFLQKLEVIDDKYTLADILQYSELRKPDAIVIDFVQNIQAEGKSEYDRMTNIAVSIQQLAIKNNIAVFDLSQVSNAGTAYAQGDAIPSKGSGALVASCDVGLMMKRDKLSDNVVIHIAKNKFGYNGKSIEFKVDFSKGVFKEIGESKSDTF